MILEYSMKKLLLLCVLVITNVVVAFAAAPLWNDDIKNNILPDTDSTVLVTDTSEGFLAFDTFLAFIRDSIFGLLAIITIGVFLVIGGKLFIARGNPEEFSKALFAFIYAVIWLVIVGLSWAAVKLIVWLKF